MQNRIAESAVDVARAFATMSESYLAILEANTACVPETELDVYTRMIRSARMRDQINPHEYTYAVDRILGWEEASLAERVAITGIIGELLESNRRSH